MNVYLLHFNRPINPSHPTQHYLGFACDLDKRIRQHRQGKGARLTQVAIERGIRFRVAEVWQGDRALRTPIEKTEKQPPLLPYL